MRLRLHSSCEEFLNIISLTSKFPNVGIIAIQSNDLVRLNYQITHLLPEMSYLRQLSYLTAAKGLVLSSFVTMCDREERAHNKHPTNSHRSRRESNLCTHYTHVVLGFGTAGSSATQELLKYARPTDTVLIVDPIVNFKKIGFPLQQDKRLAFEQNQATNIDQVHKIIELADGSRVRYQNCLISVGSTAAPFNPQYVDADCDLEQTVVDLTHPNAPHDLYIVLVGDAGAESLTMSKKNPTKSIALVGGNSWETVELAGRLAMVAEHKHHQHVQQLQQVQKLQAQQRKAQSQGPSGSPTSPTGTAGRMNGSASAALPAALTPPLPVPAKDTISLIYPAYGPMSHTLPRYLSLAVAKRLHGLGVHLVPYSYVRYLGATTSSTSSTHSKGYTTTNTSTNANNPNIDTATSQAVLFLAKTYDSLNTQSITADKVAFAPTSIPTSQDRELLKTQTHSINKTHSASTPNALKPTLQANKAALNEHHPHGFLVRSGLELDRITGGVLANMSLQVCEGVYTAGDVASVYCGGSGGVDLSGESGGGSDGGINGGIGVCQSQQRGVVKGYHNALYSGTVAGRNMAHTTIPHTKNTSTNANTNTNTCTPLLCSHVPLVEAHSADIGVHFTLVGNCSSALETHGYWWRLAGAGKSNGSSGAASVHASNTSTTASLITSPTTSNNGSGDTAEPLRPPLGLGVVFYVDNGTVAGVLISGLPVAPRHVHRVEGDTGPGATYTDHIHALCRALVGKPVKSLDTHTSTGGGNNTSKAVDITSAYELPADDDVAGSDEAALYENNSGAGTSNASTNLDVTNNTALTASAVEIYTSQVLSWEARKLISPVLSAPLYKHRPTLTTTNNTNTHNTQLLRQISAYPRPLYRYCGPAHTTIKDLTEPHTHAIIQPTVVREALFQPEFANTGSRADNVKTAYKRSMAKDLY